MGTSKYTFTLFGPTFLFATVKSNFKQSPHTSFRHRSNSLLHRKDGVVISTVNLDSENLGSVSHLATGSP